MRSKFCRMLTSLNVGVFLLASCFCTHLLAQSASVRGQVLNSGNAAVPGAEVTLVNTDTQVTLKTVSDASGVFILSPQTSGRYQATVTAPGYSTWVQSDIVLEVGEKFDLNPVLKAGTVKETVAVTATAPEIKTEDSDLSTVTEAALVANIPLDVRNPLQEVNFTVGVTQSNSQTAGTNATTQSTTNTFYISGAKGGESEIHDRRGNRYHQLRYPRGRRYSRPGCRAGVPDLHRSLLRGVRPHRRRRRELYDQVRHQRPAWRGLGVLPHRPVGCQWLQCQYRGPSKAFV